MLLEALLLVASTLPLLQPPQLARRDIREYLEDNADPDGNLWCGQTLSNNFLQGWTLSVSMMLLLLLLLFSVLSFALRVCRDVHKVCTQTETNSTRQTNMSRYVVLLWIKWCNHLSCSTLLCNKNRSTNNITGRIPVVIVGKSRCKLTSLAVKHAAATTSNILFCYFLALHSYECKARKY